MSFGKKLATLSQQVTTKCQNFLTMYVFDRISFFMIENPSFSF